MASGEAREVTITFQKREIKLVLGEGSELRSVGDMRRRLYEETSVAPKRQKIIGIKVRRRRSRAPPPTSPDKHMGGARAARRGLRAQRGVEKGHVAPPLCGAQEPAPATHRQ